MQSSCDLSCDVNLTATFHVQKIIQISCLHLVCKSVQNGRSNRMMKKPLSVSILCLVLIVLAYPVQVVSQGHRITAREWHEDLRYLASQMPLKHKSLFHTMTQSEFEQAVSVLEADIRRLDSAEIVVHLAQIGAMVQDGHTGLSLRNSGDDVKTRIPIRFMQCADGIFVRAAAPQYADAVGGKLITIGGISVEKAMERINSIISHDPGNNEEQVAWGARLFLNETVLLHGLGLSTSESSAEYVIEKGGTRRTFVMKCSEPIGTWWLSAIPPTWVDARPALQPTPLAYQHTNEHYWFTYLPERRAVYLQFNIVLNGGGESLSDFATRLGSFIEHNAVKRLVIDVRNNTGGDNTLLRPLLVTIIRSKVNERGRVYVITGPTTFSAAQNFVNRLENYAKVIFVGEPTAQNVNFYGDPTSITLPHSGLTVATASLWWQDMDPRDQRKSTSPEVAAAMTFQDYVAGRDAAVDLAMTMSVPMTIDEWMESRLAGGIDSVLAGYRAYIADPMHRYLPDQEQRLNSYGYRLLSKKRIPDAIVVFQVVAKTHPDSWNAFDSLGEAFAAAGDKMHALEAYRRSLELNPDNGNGKSMIEKIMRSHD